MPTQPCPSTAGADENLACSQLAGHDGPHIDPLYGRWRVAFGIHDGDTPALPADQLIELTPDPTIVPWESLTIDGLTIPATMFLTRGLVLDVQHGRVTLTFRVREGVSVELKRPHPDDRPDLPDPGSPVSAEFRHAEDQA